VVLVLVGVLANSEGLRATYWTARAENCGSLAINLNTLVTSTSDARHAETCYAQAAAHCQPAVLVVNAVTPESNATYSFLVEPPIGSTGACELAASADVSDGSGDSTAVAPCQHVSQTTKALTFAACGGLGDVTLPADHAGAATIG
jgi:hypothetical protein